LAGGIEHHTGGAFSF